MNTLLLEKRQDIIQNNNTAQKQLESILERLTTNPNIDTLDFKDSFHGNLDFSVLAVFGFRNIKNILFGSKGEITSISHLPSGLEMLHIANQYLVEINDLPKCLVDLNCADNYLNVLDLHYLPNLKKLNVANNKLEQLENLPESLEELYCNNNEISRLILRDNLVLRVLHCSNNKTIIIDGLPPSLVDFQCENNPYIQQNNVFDIHGGKKTTISSSTAAENEVRRVDYIEALNKYFKLKSKYESGLKKDRIAAYNAAKKNGAGKRGRAAAVARVLPKCVKCDRRVGTVFTIKNNHYIARCGDAANPCALNIKLYRGNCWPTHETVASLRDVIEDTKEMVIYTKLSSIFKYKTEKSAVDKFNELMNEYNDFNTFYSAVKNTYDLQYSDPSRDSLTQRKIDHIYKIIGAIKTLVQQYEREGNPILLQTAVRMQIDELGPEIENLRRLKYEVMEMDEDTLVQRYAAVDKSSYCVAEEGPRVVKWSV